VKVDEVTGELEESALAAEDGCPVAAISHS
jgi:ferredoxin